MVLKFGEDRMKIAFILFVYVIFSLKRSQKKPIFSKIGVKIQNFEKSKKVPRDNLEIQVVSKFGQDRIETATGS